MELPKELVGLLEYLLPGLLAAWIFFGLTSHRKPEKFERVIQALVFTFLIQVLLVVEKSVWGALYRSLGQLGPWSPSADAPVSAATAVLLGALIAVLDNRDTVHAWLRQRGFTTRTSYPSDWFGVFAEHSAYVILHLRDERRLYGWPETWPSDPSDGYFFLEQPSWQDPSESRPILGAQGVLVAAKEVLWVEFIGPTVDASNPNLLDTSETS